LNDTKADKDYVTMEVDVKADKRALESKVSRQQFDSSFNELNNLIQELLAKLDGQDGQWQDALKNLSDDLDGKLDRLELDPFKEYIQGQLNKLNRKMAKVTEIEQQKELDEAAGFRKPVPALPSTNSLPVTATLRPYTTYELEKIRQEQKTSPSVGSEDNATRFQKTMAMRKLAKLKRKNIHLYRLVINQGIDQIMAKLMKKRRHRGKDQLLKCQAARLQPLQGPTVGPTLPSLAQPAPQDYDLYFSQPRPCGGSHTMTYPNKRFTKLTAGGQYVVEEQPQVQVFHVKEELDIIGADGHIYKGRVEIDDGRLPTLTQFILINSSQRPRCHLVLRGDEDRSLRTPRSDQRPSPPGGPSPPTPPLPAPGPPASDPTPRATHVIDESTGEQQHSPPPTRQATPGEAGLDRQKSPPLRNST
ncbi:Glutamine-rich protein 2, partial [Branchiostoma belcheri]